MCTFLLNELMSNTKKIKHEKKHVFKYGSFIICLALYFLNEIPEIGKFQWAYDKLVAVQIKEGLQGVGDAITQNSSLWGYFKTFQELMQGRERIPKAIVETMKTQYASWWTRINVTWKKQSLRLFGYC